MSTTHDLKTWPEFFGAILDGRKTFEVRDTRDQWPWYDACRCKAERRLFFACEAALGHRATTTL